MPLYRARSPRSDRIQTIGVFLFPRYRADLGCNKELYGIPSIDSRVCLYKTKGIGSKAKSRSGSTPWPFRARQSRGHQPAPTHCSIPDCPAPNEAIEPAARRIHNAGRSFRGAVNSLVRPSGIEPASRRCRGRAASGNKGRAEKPRRRPRKSRSTGLNGGRAASAHPAADPSSRHWRAVNQPASAPRNDVGRHGIGKDSSSAGSANSGADCAGGNEKRAGSGTSGRAAAHRPPRCRRLRSAGYRANFHSSRILAHRGE